MLWRGGRQLRSQSCLRVCGCACVCVGGCGCVGGGEEQNNTTEHGAYAGGQGCCCPEAEQARCDEAAEKPHREYGVAIRLARASAAAILLACATISRECIRLPASLRLQTATKSCTTHDNQQCP